MTDPGTPRADLYTQTKARRHRARRVMQSLIVVCILAATGIGAEQFYARGLHAFLDRPPGVGATPPQAQSPTPAQSP